MMKELTGILDLYQFIERVRLKTNRIVSGVVNFEDLLGGNIRCWFQFAGLLCRRWHGWR